MILRKLVLAVALAAAPLTVMAAGKPSASFLPGGNSRDPVSINAAKLDYFDKERKLIYSGGVNASQGESRVKCTTMVIFLSKTDAADNAKPEEDAAAKGGPSADNSSIDRVECAGPVTIVSKGDVGTGDSGLYDKAANKFYITGKVALSQGPNVTTGDKLTYDLTTAQAVVTGNVRSLFVPGSNPDVAKKKK